MGRSGQSTPEPDGERRRSERGGAGHSRGVEATVVSAGAGARRLVAGAVIVLVRKGIRKMAAIDSLLAGAVDLHCHSGPSPMPRRITHAEAARQADEAGFRAILAKCHYHDTVTDILAMAPLLDGLRVQVFGGIALNSQNGGLNPFAVDRCLKMGGKVIWFPTISSHAHRCHAAHDEEVARHFQPRGMMQSEEISIFGADGDLKPEVHQSIGQAKEAGALI